MCGPLEDPKSVQIIEMGIFAVKWAGLVKPNTIGYLHPNWICCCYNNNVKPDWVGYINYRVPETC